MFVAFSVLSFGCSSQPKPVATPEVISQQPQQPAPEPAPAPTVKVEEPVAAPAVAAILETVYFDFDKSDLSEKAKQTIAKNAELFKKNHSTSKLTLEGSTDSRGSAEYNLALGERRAKAVEKYMTTLGISKDKINVISYGEEKPADSGETEEAWSKNRRVDFVVK